LQNLTVFNNASAWYLDPPKLYLEITRVMNALHRSPKWEHPKKIVESGFGFSGAWR
jgi:hypothetical protein